MATKNYGGKIADILLRRQLVTPEALREAEEDSSASHLRMEKRLLEKKLVSDADMTLALAEYLGMRPMLLAHCHPADMVLKLVDESLLKKHQAVPLARIGNCLTVALSDPFDLVARDELQTMTGLEVVPLVASEKDIVETLGRLFQNENRSLGVSDILEEASEDQDIIHERVAENDDENLAALLERSEGTPVIRMVSMMLIESLRQGASDIHLEPQERTLRLRYRIDGALMELPGPSKNMQGAVLSRLKLMSGMDISEHRIPQDGRIKIRALGKEVDLRVNTLPTIFGEKIVLRLLDKSKLFPSLAALGLEKIPAQTMQKAITEPNGIVLVTGPTGSGKTTTLYSCLLDLNRPDVNIITCEDPVEYQLPGINQVQINAFVGLSFAVALREVLRQSPDIILVGEIRDGETAEIAIKAALTGHLVLSTLHTNDAASAVTRMVDMGIEPSLLASALILAQAQRLIRRLCPACRQPLTKLPDKLLQAYDLTPAMFEGHTVYEAKGCIKCRNGYKGRIAIMEVLPIDRELRNAIVKGLTAREIAQYAREHQGMMSLKDIGISKVISGDTSLDAALHVTGGGT